MAARTFDGPDNDWLTLHDVLQHTGVTKSTLYRLIEEGRFPQASVITTGIRKWHWSAIVYWDLHIRFFGHPDGTKTGMEETVSNTREKPK